MKKILSLLLLCAVFSSCTEDITRNSPSVQGLKDNVLWRAGGSSATIAANGTVTITAGRQLEQLVLQTNSPEPQTFVLGNSNSRRVVFTSETGFEDATYSTGVGRGDGHIIIEEYDEVNRTISGTFRFNAVNEADEDDVLNFQEGVFYKIPYTAPIED